MFRRAWTARWPRFRVAALLAAVAGLLIGPPTVAAAGGHPTTVRVSVTSTGAQGNGGSYAPAISADGRYVAFSSNSSDEEAGDNISDVFVRDLVTGRTRRVSVGSSGAQGNGGSYDPAISADGRYVAFSSYESNLVPDDTNDSSDVFVRDLVTGRTRRVSVSSRGAQGNRSSLEPVISADGRYVAFDSGASNLVPDDTNNTYDVFVRDLVTGRTRQVSVSSSGAQGKGDSSEPVISADGRYVAFDSGASNLVPADTNNSYDVFVRDLVTGRTRRVSVSGHGAQGNRASVGPAISADGRYVAFLSGAVNLVPHDTNDSADVFVRDLVTGRTRRVSVGGHGAQGKGGSAGPAISADGRYVAFNSGASNLVPHDTNNVLDVFRRDLVTGRTRRVSMGSTGGQGNYVSYNTAISAEGRYVAFDSNASNLVPLDTNNVSDVFRRDLVR